MQSRKIYGKDKKNSLLMACIHFLLAVYNGSNFYLSLHLNGLISLTKIGVEIYKSLKLVLDMCI